MKNFFPGVPIVTYGKNGKIKHSNFSTSIVHTAAAHDAWCKWWQIKHMKNGNIQSTGVTYAW